MAGRDSVGGKGPIDPTNDPKFYAGRDGGIPHGSVQLKPRRLLCSLVPRKVKVRTYYTVVLSMTVYEPSR